MVGWTEIGGRGEQIAGAGKRAGLSSDEFYLFIYLFLFIYFFTCAICKRISRMDASVCGLPAHSYPDSCSRDHAGDLIGGFSTLLPVVACNYCYRPASSFKLLLFFLFFFTIKSYFRTEDMYQGSRLDSI